MPNNEPMMAELRAALAMVTAAATITGDPARDVRVMAAAVAASAELDDPLRILDGLRQLAVLLAGELAVRRGVPVGQVLSDVGARLAAGTVG